jgi:hypothetical protein
VFCRIALYSTVTAAHVAAGLNGVEWCNSCCTAVGCGKGGGRPELGNANIPYTQHSSKDVTTVYNIAVGAAREFAARFSN